MVADDDRRRDLEPAPRRPRLPQGATPPTTPPLSHVGQPTVILAKTIKGFHLGSSFEGRNATHQMKKMTLANLKEFRDNLHIPITDAQLEADPYQPPYYHPGESAPEIEYLQERRARLGGYVPERRVVAKPLVLPGDKVYDVLRPRLGQAGDRHHDGVRPAGPRPVQGPGDRQADRADHPGRGPHLRHGLVLPDAEDLQPAGQLYTAVDANLMLAYKESEQGVILHEGIDEAGSIATFTAVGTRYATHGEPMIPMYIFYSMFGFQRTGDGHLGGRRPDGAAASCSAPPPAAPP